MHVYNVLSHISYLVNWLVRAQPQHFIRERAMDKMYNACIWKGVFK